MLGNGTSLSADERGLLLHLQRQALDYFLENQLPCGLVLDRQHNRGPRRSHGLCSTSATGMGFIALALATAPPYRLLSASLIALAGIAILAVPLATRWFTEGWPLVGDICSGGATLIGATACLFGKKPACKLVTSIGVVLSIIVAVETLVT